MKITKDAGRLENTMISIAACVLIRMSAVEVMRMKASRCPKCNGPVYVSDSRLVKSDLSIRRRKVCDKCGFRYTTYEIIGLDYERLRRKDKLESDLKKMSKKLSKMADDFKNILT